MSTTKPTVFLLINLLFAGAIDCPGQETASQETASQETTPQELVPADDKPQLSEHELAVLYTQTNLSMAELELQRALELNKGEVKVIPRLAVERLRSNLAVAKEQYRQATLESSEGPKKVRLRHAQEKVRLAKVDLEAGLQLKELKALSEWEEKRLRLKYDLAKLNLALMQHPEGYGTLLDSMQRQLDRFGEEILTLDQRLTKLEGGNPRIQ